ncbi:MAG: WLM domain protein [Firmicutes bacterium ADurb.Bin419]|nr:MAG: WLM domain protein [Firmicutes bacterium ADurb.Bin419]
MKLSYEYGTQKIEFTVILKNRKTLSIQVEAPDIITVKAPIGTSEARILEAVKSKSKWIVQKLFEIKEMEYRKRTKQYINGESFIYMGRNYSLQIEYDEKTRLPEAKLVRGKFYVYTNSKEEKVIKRALENWYKDKAEEKVRERVNYYQSYFDVIPTKITVKDQQKRWGSCTAKRELFFNWKCVMAPSPALDYIVVHEMCHLVHMNHSKEFWQLLKKVLPDYESRKARLRDNGIKYDL